MVKRDDPGRTPPSGRKGAVNVPSPERSPTSEIEVWNLIRLMTERAVDAIEESHRHPAVLALIEIVDSDALAGREKYVVALALRHLLKENTRDMLQGLAVSKDEMLRSLSPMWATVETFFQQASIEGRAELDLKAKVVSACDDIMSYLETFDSNMKQVALTHLIYAAARESGF